MEEELRWLSVALRVLAAVTEFREPEETDIQTLRSYAPLFTLRPPGELAREVIQQRLKARGRVSEALRIRFEGASPDASIDPAKH
jgi:hypothetical protein